MKPAGITRHDLVARLASVPAHAWLPPSGPDLLCEEGGSPKQSFRSMLSRLSGNERGRNSRTTEGSSLKPLLVLSRRRVARRLSQRCCNVMQHRQESSLLRGGRFLNSAG